MSATTQYPRYLVVLLLVVQCFQVVVHSFSLSKSISRPLCNGAEKIPDEDAAPTAPTTSRRNLLGIITTIGATGACSVGFPSVARASYDDNSVILRLETPQDKAGLALYDVTIGSPPRTVVAIKRVLSPPPGNPRLRPGLVLKDYPNSLAVLDRIRQGPYPVELEFYNLDASNGELGEALTAQDALQLAQQQAAALSSTNQSANTEDTNTAYIRRVVKEAPEGTCRIRSRRDDVLEINYTAHLGTLQGVVYDASAFRGTGRPYQMVLGSGDMIPGVDQGLINMCPGEVRQIEIPPNLAYGQKGNKLFRIPPNTRLVWEVELVSVNSVRQGQDGDDL